MNRPFAPVISLRAALGIAVVLHIFLILALSFSAAKPSRINSIDVTIATTRSEITPEDATHIAQNDQLGSGTLKEAKTPTTKDTAKFTDNIADDVNKTKQTQKSDLSDIAIVQSQKNNTKTSATKNTQKQDESTTGTDDIQRQLQAIKALEAKVARTTQAYAQRPRIHHLTSVTAKAAVDADYQRRWQEKIELVGNTNYPKSAIEKNIFGDVRLSVLLTPSGAVKRIKLLKSSGNQILDQFAIASVKLSAPFSPFPKELAAKADLLEIIRTWQFRNNTFSAGN